MSHPTCHADWRSSAYELLMVFHLLGYKGSSIGRLSFSFQNESTGYYRQSYSTFRTRPFNGCNGRQGEIYLYITGMKNWCCTGWAILILRHFTPLIRGKIIGYIWVICLIRIAFYRFRMNWNPLQNSSNNAEEYL